MEAEGCQDSAKPQLGSEPPCTVEVKPKDKDSIILSS